MTKHINNIFKSGYGLKSKQYNFLSNGATWQNLPSSITRQAAEFRTVCNFFSWHADITLKVKYFLIMIIRRTSLRQAHWWAWKACDKVYRYN